MSLIKVTFIIPYDDIQDEVYSSLQEIHEEGVVFETTKIIGTQEAMLKESNSEIVIARGVT